MQWSRVALLCLFVGLSAVGVRAPAPGTVQVSAESRTGIFLILDEAASPGALRQTSPDEYVALYDYKFLDMKDAPKPKYFVLRKEPDVRFHLAVPPARVVREDGRTELRIELTKDATAEMERLTRAHLGESAAFVVDGEVITAHKIRAVITNGQFQVSRCTDNACEYILARLKVRGPRR